MELITAKELLAKPVFDDGSTMLDLFEFSNSDGMFGTVGLEANAEELEVIFNRTAERIRLAVLQNVMDIAGNFGGDACDFSEWVRDEVKKCQK